MGMFLLETSYQGRHAMIIYGNLKRREDTCLVPSIQFIRLLLPHVQTSRCMCDGACPPTPFPYLSFLSRRRPFLRRSPPNAQLLRPFHSERRPNKIGDEGGGPWYFRTTRFLSLLFSVISSYAARLFSRPSFSSFTVCAISFFLFLLLFSTFTIAFPSFISTPFITPMVQKVVLTFTALCCLLPSSLAAPTQRAPLNGHFLHLTDIHPDAFYLQGSIVASSCHSLSNVTSTVDIPKSESGYFGTPDSICDTPFSLVNATFDWIDRHLEPVDFVVWTGDNARYGTGFSFSLSSFPPLFFFPLICRGN